MVLFRQLVTNLEPVLLTNSICRYEDGKQLSHRFRSGKVQVEDDVECEAADAEVLGGSGCASARSMSGGLQLEIQDISHKV